ncbi:peroxide stress protein YaaA [Amphritea sp. 1_MG-2023]|uniref:peroxide stress protein YaaA n=1 Tax=Amphritea sp. 1_MG-2023 TaxID=3062670 RepID=UPI0026E23FEE|nr:peroxide stress protein YaaA [Amphritea sp. 1_MG-2023]MDO6562923.1 peroxide stress protein YaaA [Amphritea sp. 1_MG-2023]
MLLVISPAKNLDYDTPAITERYTQPQHLDQSKQLIDTLRSYSVQAVAELMKLSDKLAALNVARYESWSEPFTQDNAKQALLAFNGDVYSGLNATDFNADDLTFTQQHLRILSGLYGVLKPLDLMQPYRLEMGTKLNNARGKDLYTFWGDIVTEDLNQTMADDETPILINLASNEYFKSVKPKSLNARIITPVFKDWKNGQYKIISFYAKKARGLMCRYAIKNRIVDAEQLKQFDLDGYQYDASQSQGDTWVFTRQQA